MSDFVLYNYFRSSTSYRARIALNLKGINYEYRPVHLVNHGGEQNRPEYRSINPMGGVPSLIHTENGSVRTIAQSRAIIDYLDQIAPTPALYPVSAYERALVNQLCDNINCEIQPLTNLRVMKYIETKLIETKLLATSPDTVTTIKDAWIQHWNLEGLTACEKILEKTSGRFSVGDQITVADVFLVPHLFSANRFKVNLSGFPHILRINEECLKHSAFQKAHPHRQIDTPIELKTEV